GGPTPGREARYSVGRTKMTPEIGAAYLLGRSVIARGGPPMGRGRAKAKQTKVARELKYSSPQTDFQRLQAELSGSESDGSGEFDGDARASDEPWSDDD